MKTQGRRGYSKSEADLLAMRIRRENNVNVHRQAQERYMLSNAIKTAEDIRNYQNQYGILKEEVERMPLALQGAALQRFRDIGNTLQILRANFPYKYPRGADPHWATAQANRRRIN